MASVGQFRSSATIQKEEIVFEPSAPYLKTKMASRNEWCKPMDMTRATIFEGSIDDDFWPEIILLMTYIKNRPTKSVHANATTQEAQ